MKKKLEITVGADPEVVIVDGRRGTPISALRVLRCTKDNPIDLGDGIRTYADNVLLEAAFTPVSPDKIVARIGDVIRRLTKLLEDKYSLMYSAATEFPKKELRSKLAWAIGCNPNFDAYRQEPNDMGAGFTSNLRTGSFHIHIGNKDWERGEDKRLLSPESQITAIKLLDIFLGMPSVLFDTDPTAIERRKLYGKAGEFRPTKYGIEYRVLGNYALAYPRLVQLVFDLAHEAMFHVQEGTEQDILKLFNPKDIIHTINTGDEAMALDMLKLLPISSHEKGVITAQRSGKIIFMESWATRFLSEKGELYSSYSSGPATFTEEPA